MLCNPVNQSGNNQDEKQADQERTKTGDADKLANKNG